MQTTSTIQTLDLPYLEAVDPPRASAPNIINRKGADAALILPRPPFEFGTPVLTTLE